MAQPKGSTGNPNGRPKGSPNKVNQPIRDAINAIVEGAIPDFISVLADLRETNPRAYADNVLKLLEYTTPKLRSVDSKVEVDENSIESIQIILGKK